MSIKAVLLIYLIYSFICILQFYIQVRHQHNSVEPRGLSVRCVSFGYQTQSNLVEVYTIGSMVCLRHWFYPKDKCLLWQKLTKQFIMFKCNNIFKYNNNITSPRAIIMNMSSPLWNCRSS